MAETALTADSLAQLLTRFHEPIDRQLQMFSLERTFEALGAGLRDALDAAHVCIWIPHPQRGELSLAFSSLELRDSDDLLAPLPFEGSRCGEALHSGRPRFYPSLDLPTPCCKRDRLEAENLTQAWVFPIYAMPRSAENSVCAVASAHFRADALAPPRESILPYIGQRAGAAIAKSLWAETDHLVQQAYQQIDFSRGQVWTTLDRVACVIRDALDFEACSLLLADVAGESLQIVGTTGVESRESRNQWIYPHLRSVTGRVARELRTIAVEDVRGEPSYEGPLLPDITASKRRQYLGTPILNGDKLIGVVRLRNKRQHGHWSPRLNALDEQRAVRLAAALAPLLSLAAESLRGREILQRIRHDLKVPPQVIANTASYYAEQFRRGRPPRTEELIQKLEDIESFAGVMVVLANMSRLDEPLRPQHIFLLGESVAKLCKMLSPLCAKHRVTRVQADDFRDVPKLWVDPVLIEIALYNLLTNAIKYAHGGTEVIVESEHDPQGTPPGYRIHVKNWGIGVDARDRDRVFDAYFRSSDAVKVDVTGLGLGLPISRGIVERHGGTLTLTSLANPTCFTISLPAWLSGRRPDESREARIDR